PKAGAGEGSWIRTRCPERDKEGGRPQACVSTLLGRGRGHREDLRAVLFEQEARRDRVVGGLGEPREEIRPAAGVEAGACAGIERAGGAEQERELRAALTEAREHGARSVDPRRAHPAARDVVRVARERRLTARRDRETRGDRWRRPAARPA